MQMVEVQVSFFTVAVGLYVHLYVPVPIFTDAFALAQAPFALLAAWADETPVTSDAATKSTAVAEAINFLDTNYLHRPNNWNTRILSRG
jgi:hypothetical protein